MADEKEKKADKSTPVPPVPAGEKRIALRFNYRYQNINAGEVAGYPEKEALELLAKEVEVGGKNIKVCERYVEPKAEAPK